MLAAVEEGDPMAAAATPGCAVEGQPKGSMNVPVKNTVLNLMTPSQFTIYGITTVFRIQSYKRWKMSPTLRVTQSWVEVRGLG